MSSLPIDAVPPTTLFEPRIAKLEAHAEHAASDLKELRSEVRAMDARMSADIRALDSRLSTDLRRLDAKVDQHLIILLGAIAGSFTTLAGLIAKGFHWL